MLMSNDIRHPVQNPERGSAEAILQAQDRVAPLLFEPGELDALLAEIDEMRNLDLEEPRRRQSLQVLVTPDEACEH
jgi:hypothetical protein